MDILKSYKKHLKADIDNMTAKQFYKFIAQLDSYSNKQAETNFGVHLADCSYSCYDCRKDNDGCEGEKYEDDPDYKDDPCMMMFLKHCEEGEK